MEQDIIRVLRIIEYVGPRNKVEDTVKRSIHGEKVIEDLTIKAVTLGTVSEILGTTEYTSQEDFILVPWDFRQNRCLRTLKNMRPEFMELEPEFLGVRHNALDDAMHQTKWLHSILNLLEGYYTPWPI